MLCALISCQKDITGEIAAEGPGPGNDTFPPASMKAKINGILWTADRSASAIRYTAGNNVPAFVLIHGFSNDGRFMSIKVLDSGVHTYNFYDTTFNEGVYNDPFGKSFSTNQGPSDTVLAGTVEITKIDSSRKVMSGNFSYKIYRRIDNTEISISEGSFTNIPYGTRPYIPPSRSTDTFHVKINDTLFKAYGISAYIGATDSILRVTGSDTFGYKIVGLSFPDSILTGSYTLSTTGKYLAAYSSYNTVLPSKSGSMEIIENDTATKRVRGNFTFRGELPTDSTKFAKMTEGYFSVKYQ